MLKLGPFFVDKSKQANPIDETTETQLQPKPSLVIKYYNNCKSFYILLVISKTLPISCSTFPTKT